MKISKRNLYSDIKNIVAQATSNAFRAVNFSMVIAYWEIGKRIVEDEQQGKKRAGYGEHLLEELSVKLTKDFGKGFTYRNIAVMRQFYLAFPILHALRAESSRKNISTSHSLRTELTWTHYRLLIRVGNAEARKYYMNEAADNNWSTRTLERQINSLYFERLLSSKNKKNLIQKTAKEAKKDSPTILDFVKDPYILEFLQLNPNATLYEQELETELLTKLQSFLLGLGKGFSFVARQQRISAEGEHFFVDLVFYNYVLKYFVLIDLKVGKLSHQDIANGFICKVL